ncbi:hypothetical protein ACFQ4C_03590 [Larkinella insperata]|uniref:Uncharacterized protein n=1 Tax=Larkinella insperata TaxID=332158 RepID=A0ABW3Q4Y7_9BACT|nr:hypothetical protein [Larkinella insperata]
MAYGVFGVCCVAARWGGGSGLRPTASKIVSWYSDGILGRNRMVVYENQVVKKLPA